MKQIILTCAALALASLWPLRAADTSPKKPNFVVIIADDHTYRAIGYQNPAVKTPNMDRLAGDGFRFDRAFVASPICAASRASIFTGVFPQQHGTVGLSSAGFTRSVVVEKRLATLPAALGQAGYHTALYGKSHLGAPTTFGFAEGREIGDHNDEETFAEAEKFLRREAGSGRPFLLWLTPHNPHLPFSASQRFKDLYKDADIKLDPNWRESPLLQSFFNQGAAGEIVFRDGKYPIFPKAPAGMTGGPPRSEANMKEVIKAYYADVSCLDEQIGRLLGQLKASGLYDHTILIYVSDNGYHLGNHGLGNKITMHEESVRVPMFVHSPLLPVQRARSDALVSTLDVYPTLLDFAGTPVPEHLMGKSLRPILNTPTAKVRDYVVSECVGPPEKRLGTGHRMLRTGHFKFILSSSNEEAFFDLRNDPFEMQNLIGDASLKDEIVRHRTLLRGWMTSIGEKRFKSAALHSADTVAKANNGELLYNGIVLAKVWPPQDRDPLSDEPMPVPYLTQPPRVIPIDVGRQLFVDDFLIESTDMKRTFHHAERFAGNPVFKPQTPDELKLQSWVLTGNGGVFFDPTEQVFKMYYTAGWRGGLALATSKDMIHWTRPELGIAGGNVLLPAGVKWAGDPTLKTAGSDNCVWLDLSATNPAERLKYMTCWMHVADPKDRPAGFHHTLHVSADGRVWAPEARTTIAAHDYSTFLFNPFRQVWVSSIRYNNDTSRARRRKYSENKDFMRGADWSKAVYWTGADTLDAPEPAGRHPGAGDLPQLYSLNAVAYESLMVGMHYLHRGPSNEIAGSHQVPKLIDLELGYSRDGFHWHRPDRSGFIAGTRKAGDWDRGYLLGAAGVFVVLGDKLIFPYTGCSGIGPDGARGIYNGGSIGLAMLRRDGFASMDSTDKPATLTTRPIIFKGSYLFVNIADPKGTLHLEALHESGTVIITSEVITADQTKQPVTWKHNANLAALIGKPARLRFHLTNGSLYSFWITSDPAGASHGYVAAGGPAYSGTMDISGSGALKNER